MDVSTISKLTLEQLRAYGVQALSDRPNSRNSFGESGLNATALKQWFDNMPKMLLQKVNEIIDVLASDDSTKYLAYAFTSGSFSTASLYELIESFKDGNLAKHFLKLKPNGSLSSSLDTLQNIIDDIAESIANNTEDIEGLEDGSAALNQISFTMSDSNVLTIVFKNKDGDNDSKVSYQLDLNVGTSKLDDSAVTTGKIANGAVNSDKLDTSSVITAKIADGAVTSTKIATDGVQTDNIKAENVTTPKIATGAVTTDKIANGNVTTNKIADSNVTEAKIATGAVTTNKVADGGVTEGKLSSGVSTKLNAGFKQVSFNGSTGVLTFTDNAGNTQTVDLPTELIVSSGYYDEDTEDVILVLANGDEISIPLDDMLAGVIDYVDNIHASIYDLQEAPPLAALEGAYLLTTPTLAQLADLAS